MRVELERAEHDVDGGELRILGERGQGAIEATLADVAPRADDVREHLDRRSSDPSPRRYAGIVRDQVRRPSVWARCWPPYRESARDMNPPDVQATFCATLVDEWVHHGVTPRRRRPRFAQHADGPGPRRPCRVAPSRRPRRAGSGVRRPRPRAGRHARRAAVHQWDGGRQLPPGCGRGRAVERADDRRHGRSSAGAPRRRGRPDRRPERPLRPVGALVSRSRHCRRRRRGQLALARATVFRRRGNGPGAPQPAVPRAVPR